MRYIINYKGGSEEYKGEQVSEEVKVRVSEFINLAELLVHNKKSIITVVLFIQLICEYSLLLQFSGIEYRDSGDYDRYDYDRYDYGKDDYDEEYDEEYCGFFKSYNGIFPNEGLNLCIHSFEEMLKTKLNLDIDVSEELRKYSERTILSKDSFKETDYSSLWDSRNYSLYMLENLFNGSFNIEHIGTNDITLGYCVDKPDDYEIPEEVNNHTIAEALSNIKIMGHIFILNYKQRVEFISIQSSLELFGKKMRMSEILFNGTKQYMVNNRGKFMQASGGEKMVYAWAWPKISNILQRHYGFKYINNVRIPKFIFSDDNHSNKVICTKHNSRKALCNILKNRFLHKAKIDNNYILTYKTNFLST